MMRSISKVSITLFTIGCMLFCPAGRPLFAQDARSTESQQAAPKPEAATLRQPPAFSLEDGTPVKLRLTSDLSSANAVVGQTVDFRVVEAVRVKDIVVIPEGGIAWATVTEAQHKRHLGRGGKLNVMIDKVRLADGERAPLRAVREAQGGGHVGAMTTGMVLTGIVFFPAAPLFLFMHGKDITIPQGTEITAYINGDYALERATFEALGAGKAEAGAAQESQSASAGALAPIEAPDLTVISVKSTPPGADILVDGKFVGNTPSTLRLPAGEHKIRIEKSGYRAWEKALTVDGKGTRSVTADLSP